jgi:hypothetical protein
MDDIKKEITKRLNSKTKTPHHNSNTHHEVPSTPVVTSTMRNAPDTNTTLESHSSHLARQHPSYGQYPPLQEGNHPPQSPCRPLS